jgi:hypothetical protein
MRDGGANMPVCKIRDEDFTSHLRRTNMNVKQHYALVFEKHGEKA